MKPKSLSISKEKLVQRLHVLRQYAALIFFIFLIAVYGFLTWRIISLSQEQPNITAISTQLKTVGVPKVDSDVVNKMQSLEDNSVSVHTLFDQARQNPFSE